MEAATNGLSELNLGRIPVYLLKTRSAGSDSYEERLEQLDDGGYQPIFVPVLDFAFRDDALRTIRRSAERFAFAGGSEADLRRRATNNPAKKYGGIVFTSQHAVEAFATVVVKLDPAKLDSFFDKEMPLYVIGPATARGVRALGLPCSVIGEQTGNGEALAKYILQWHKTLPPDTTHLNDRKLPLLFLVGEQHRDVIPKTLQSEDVPASDRIPMTEVIVYETGEMVTFEEDFTELIQQAKAAKVKEQWAVVFSPQGCEAMLNGLGWLDEKSGKFNSMLREVVSGPMLTRIATIGPTTQAFLRDNLGFEPDVCCATPSAEGVAAAISNFCAA